MRRTLSGRAAATALTVAATVFVVPSGSALAGSLPHFEVARIHSQLARTLSDRGFNAGSAVHIRIYKQSSELELWLRRGGKLQRFRTYRICRWSGAIGPKLLEGDKQSPEGVYSITRAQLRPRTKNHRAIDLAYPNAYDYTNKRTGSFLQIHGGCGSIGCFAMTNANMEEIFHLVEAAFKGGQKRVAIHIFPFRMTTRKLAARAEHEWAPFWRMLQPVHAAFKASGDVPDVRVCGTRYVVWGARKKTGKCKLLWDVPRHVYLGASSRVSAGRDPRIKVLCNLARASCKRWLFLQKKKLARRARRAG